MAQSFRNMAAEEDTMDIDIDIDMDVDVDVDVGIEKVPEPELEEGEEYEGDTPLNAPPAQSLIPAIYSEDQGNDIQPTKVHIRGIDDMSTDDVREYAMNHFPTAPSYVQWIDDTSANLVYSTNEDALNALAILCAVPLPKAAIEADPLRLRDAKSYRDAHLQIRRAIAKDKKKRNAKDTSRYYQLHPEADPVERMRTEFANGRRRRSGDHGDYNRRRYNDREDRRRRDLDADGDGGEYNASMYDDNPEPQQARGRGQGQGRGRRGQRDRSASPGRSINEDEIVLDYASGSDNENDRSFRQNRNANNRYRDRSLPPSYSVDDPHPFPQANREKELFPSNSSTNGQLASDALRARRAADRSTTVSKLKKELFPNRTDRSNHRRNDAIDARAVADAKNSDDLSSRMSGRMGISDQETKPRAVNAGRELFSAASTNGTSTLSSTNAGKELFTSSNNTSGILSATTSTPKELFPDPASTPRELLPTTANAPRELFPTSSGAGGGTLLSSTSQTAGSESGGFNIRGSGGMSIKGGAGLSIKGAATPASTTQNPGTRELFPETNGSEIGGGRTMGNEGRELFSDSLGARGRRGEGKRERPAVLY